MGHSEGARRSWPWPGGLLGIDEVERFVDRRVGEDERVEAERSTTPSSGTKTAPRSRRPSTPRACAPRARSHLRRRTPATPTSPRVAATSTTLARRGGASPCGRRDERVGAGRRVREAHRRVPGCEHAAHVPRLRARAARERGVGVLPPVAPSAARSSQLRRTAAGARGAPTGARCAKRLGVDAIADLVRTELEEPGVECRTRSGMSRPSSHTIGASATLWCSCHRHPAVSSRSPRRIATGSPSTTVQTPSPSSTNRNALCEWRCAGATPSGRGTARPPTAWASHTAPA